MGNALGIAQFGGTSPTAKPWRGVGPGVLEIVESHDGNAYRAVYTVRFEKAVYVLMRFRRSRRPESEPRSAMSISSPNGSRPPPETMRNTMASRNAEGRREAVTRGTGNVFADLGFPDAAERQAKLRLAYALNQVLEERKLSQADAAKVLGVTQPKVSALRHYKLAGFSVERLMNLLTALDQDVEIVIRKKPRSRKAGRISVVAA